MNAYGIPWYAWVMIAVVAFKPLAMPFFIGKDRQPYTATDCLLTSVFAALYIWAVVELAT